MIIRTPTPRTVDYVQNLCKTQGIECRLEEAGLYIIDPSTHVKKVVTKWVDTGNRIARDLFNQTDIKGEV